MNKGLKVFLSLVLIPVAFVLGFALCAVLPSSPGLFGLLLGGLMVSAVGLSLASSVVLAVSFGAGSCLLLEIAMPGWYKVGLWLTALLLLAVVGLYALLRRKEKPGQVMLYGFAGIFAACALAAILYTKLQGDVVDAVLSAYSSMMERVGAENPEMVSLILSMLSVNGILDDVGLSGVVTDMATSTQAILINSMRDVLESSLRYSLLDMLTGLSLHGAFWGTVLPLLCAGRQREKYSELPELALFKVPPRVSALLMLSALMLSFLTMVSEKGYALYLAVWTAVRFVFGLQGLSIGEWFLAKKHWNVFWRRALLLATFLVLPRAWFLLGFIDGLFDFRHTRPRMNVRIYRNRDFNDNDDPNDDENKEE